MDEDIWMMMGIWEPLSPEPTGDKLLQLPDQ